jgi:light-regulated signal transduction histidine kinase (bacteriophytochrome)
LANLQIPIQQSGAHIRAAALPHVHFPRVHMLELLQNLVNNAIKYRGAKAPEILVSASRKNGDWVFSVEDNGMGIAPQHQQNIFGVFKRLHGNNIPGTGIGLAICRRLVEQHHGRIWVESQVNRGSTFYFSLPAMAMEQKNGSAHA